jgi:hypothetical protein
MQHNRELHVSNIITLYVINCRIISTRMFSVVIKHTFDCAILVLTAYPKGVQFIL